jgi:hypothetical protein
MGNKPARIGRAIVCALAGCISGLQAQEDGPVKVHPVVADLRIRFELEVTHRVSVPVGQQLAYAARLDDEFVAVGRGPGSNQFVVLVDRNPKVQIAVLLWGRMSFWHWVGATHASTGLAGAFEHFATPLGVFEHSLMNPDFRAEGTYNKFHIRGYGVRGMRVYDLGWVRAEKGWGAGGEGVMRLQMHATDPAVLEPLLGRAASKGCIRIPASFNVFLDRYGLLGEDYFLAEKRGQPQWVLRADREPTAWPGRYVVVVDSMLRSRPDWLHVP